MVILGPGFGAANFESDLDDSIWEFIELHHVPLGYASIIVIANQFAAISIYVDEVHLHKLPFLRAVLGRA